jgi:hypothetical protein
VPKSREQSFAKAGIAARHGRAHFVGSTAVEVGEDVLEGRYVVIATGAMLRKLGIRSSLLTLPHGRALKSRFPHTRPSCNEFLASRISRLAQSSAVVRLQSARTKHNSSSGLSLFLKRSLDLFHASH